MQAFSKEPCDWIGTLESPPEAEKTGRTIGSEEGLLRQRELAQQSSPRL